MDDGIKVKRAQNPRANANIFEVVTFSWMTNLFKKGRQKELEINDLYTNLNEHTSMTLGNNLEENWKKELTDAIRVNRRPSLLRALIRTFGRKIMLIGLLITVCDIILKMPQPVMVGKLLLYFHPEGSKHTDLAHTYMYAVGLTLCNLGSVVIFHTASLEMSHFGMKIRVACCSAIFRKTLCLSRTALGQTRAGQIVNLLSNDVNRFDSALFLLHYLWISPLQTIIVTCLIWQEIGVSSIIGLSALIVFIPLQGWLGKKSSEFRLKTAVRTDERVRLMNEIISGIQVIKMYTWEKPFAYLVQCARRMEIKQVKGSSYIRAILASYTAFHTRTALSFCVFSYVFLGHTITVQKVFIITAYYNLIRTSISTTFPQGIAAIAEVLITIKRIQDFLLFEEKHSQITYDKKTEGAVKNKVEKVIYKNGDSSIILNNGSTPQSDPVGIIVTNATAKWTDVQVDNSLKNVNLVVKPGRLAAIIGPVGAGKSSLIQALLRELPLSEGSISLQGVISYAAQEPWLFASSIQQNILFGLPMDTGRYEQVIQACALKTDFKRLPYGDRTIVGEKGVSLSGGQRARINLARAIYKQADIYLLDDPLSAVDTHVGRHLFEKCIQGFLRGKTCILITHQVQYLNNVDQIVLMDNGNVLMEGTYNEIQATNLDFAKLLLSSDLSNEDASEPRNKNYLDPNIISDRRGSIRSVSSFTDKSIIDEVQQKMNEAVEERASGNIPFRVYMAYLFAGGRKCKIIFFITICLLTQVLISSGDLWITHWVNLEDHVFNNKGSVSPSTSDKAFIGWWTMSRENCCLIYAVLIVMIIVAAFVRSATFVSVCLTASINLHDNMFNALSRATIYFFNTHSSGHILNHFSKDVGCIDEVLPVIMMDCIHSCLTLLGIFIVIGTINIYLMTPICILAFIFYKISAIYLSTSRSLKRLEGITRTPIFAHLNTSIQGLTTIRAFKAEKVLSSEFDNHQDLHSSTWYLFITSSRAFGLWLDLICLTYITIVIFSIITFTNGGTFGGNVGLAITQAFGLFGMFQRGIRQVAELENNMTSVERVLEYTSAPKEAALDSTLDKTLASNWPSRGQILFKNFCLRYGPNSQNVLSDLNVNIESMQKVGIVGRTGAGKSSMIAALFRLASNEGSILIDGIDIHDLGLHKLRSSISIIPQEPILFSGKLRTNLDPFDEYSDHALWNALEEVELKGVVEDLPDGLDSKMAEGGSNFSLGQRQLVCLARAVVRNNKILVLDEATANVDPQTDALIQNTIRNKFRTSTVLTIAHRLNTVMDSDKIIVMDAGKVVEFDHPYNLLKNKEGFLCRMVQQTGSATADMLHKVAAEAFLSYSHNEIHKDVK